MTQESDRLINQICFNQIEPKKQLVTHEIDLEMIETVESTFISSEDVLDKKFCLSEFANINKSLAFIIANQETILNHQKDWRANKSDRKIVEAKNGPCCSTLNCILGVNLSILVVLLSICSISIYALYLLYRKLTGQDV